MLLCAYLIKAKLNYSYKLMHLMEKNSANMLSKIILETWSKSSIFPSSLLFPMMYLQL